MACTITYEYEPDSNQCFRARDGVRDGNAQKSTDECCKVALMEDNASAI